MEEKQRHYASTTLGSPSSKQ